LFLFVFQAVTLFFLLRVEPYTHHAVTFQGGHFEDPDRMFTSLPRCWNQVMTIGQDLKELVPELFCLPDMFRNVNGVDLGCHQDGALANDVELPPWASSPEDFVRIHRLVFLPINPPIHLPLFSSRPWRASTSPPT
jgi:hypothetical protein